VPCLKRNSVYVTDDLVREVRPRSVVTETGKEYFADAIVCISETGL
jgi:hypothetical protein